MGVYDIWIYTDTHIWRPGPNLHVDRLEPYDLGTEPEPSLRLTGEMLESLLAEAEKVIPASHATERHLTDVISVRDRLLALVEDGWSN